jgi:Xaa-Pro dipeptidase
MSFMPSEQDRRLQRVARVSGRVGQRALDGLALLPGPNLFYLTGLSFHLSERPIVAFFLPERRAAMVVPQLEASRVAANGLDLEPFPYTDEEGPARAFGAACDALRLAGRSLGAEALRMRLAEIELLEQAAPGVRLAPADDVLSELRIRKDEQELALMRRAAQITERALAAVLSQVRPGLTEREVASLLLVEQLRAGADALAFDPIVVAGPNAASPHATPSDRPIGRGETITLDFGAAVGGYAADITRTVVIGALAPELARVYMTVRAANAAGCAAARPGASAAEIDQAARGVIDAAGYGARFIHRTGHGLGLETHEPPYIVAGSTRLLEPGMVFTVEPGIYLPGLGGVRIEDDMVVTADGSESLTAFPRELLAL